MGNDIALSVAIANLRRGDVAGAEENCRGVLRADPGNVRALHFFVVLSSPCSDLGRATDLFRRAFSRAPNDTEIRVRLAKTLSDSGRAPEAEESGRQALAMQSGQPDAHADFGVMRRRACDLPGAVASYREALHLKPSCPLVRYNVVASLRPQVEIAEAIGHAARAANQLPDATASRILMTELRLKSRGVDAALADRERWPNHEACHRRAIVLQAAALPRIGKHESSRAILDLDRMLRLRRIDPPAHTRMRLLSTPLLPGRFRKRKRPRESTAGLDSSRPARSREVLCGAGGVPEAAEARIVITLDAVPD